MLSVTVVMGVYFSNYIQLLGVDQWQVGFNPG